MSVVSIIENIRRGKVWNFHGGLHPDEHKKESSDSPLVEAGIPPFIVIPLKQHSGKPGRLLVKAGDYVKTGQQLTASDHPMEVPVHASTSGIISSIEHHTVAHPSGLSEPCIHIKPDGLDTWREQEPWPDFRQHDALSLLERIRQAGVAGLGGAVFPTYPKLSVAREKAKIVIINGAECEPYITADDRLMREHAREIVEGIEIMKHILRPTISVIAIEDNKPEAIAAFLQLNLPDDIVVRVIPTKYPSGSARQLIEVLTGKQVPANGRSLSLGIVMVNVGTVFAIRQAIIEDEPLIRRVVTLTGSQFQTKGNAWVRLGSSVRWLLSQFKLHPEPRQRVIMGGPMMGFTLPHADVPVVKMTNCLLAPSQIELSPRDDEMNCIRCGKCADACPVKLLPQQLYWYSKSADHENAEKYKLDDCIECGACAWVCPSNIPLVHYYRQEKAEIAQLKEETAQAERAKLRFEAKKLRLEEEKKAREQTIPGARVATPVSESSDTANPITAAIMRIKAKKAEPVAEPSEVQTDQSDLKAQREARKAQARAHQAEKSQQLLNAETPAVEEDPKKAAIAAALARAKARKAELEASQANNAQATNNDNAPASDPKKAAVAAAIAQVKAKQSAQTEPEKTASPAEASADTDPKKAAIAAAIARVKAKQAAQAQAQAEPEKTATPVETPADADAKKAAVAAAIARVKAKQAAQAAGSVNPDVAVASKTHKSDTQNEPVPVTEEPSDLEAKRKAAIAAAIARVKAKKSEQE